MGLWAEETISLRDATERREQQEKKNILVPESQKDKTVIDSLKVNQTL